MRGVWAVTKTEKPLTVEVCVRNGGGVRGGLPEEVAYQLAQEGERRGALQTHFLLVSSFIPAFILPLCLAGSSCSINI